MKNQILKAATMFVGIIALALASAIAASAQNPRNLVVNIPFEFSVKGATLQPGEYIVSRNATTDGMSLIMKRRDGKGSAIVLAKSIQGEERQSQSRLVFNRYGEHYFLSQVWTSGDQTGRELYKTKRERSLGMELARSNARPETVALVARTQ